MTEELVILDIAIAIVSAAVAVGVVASLAFLGCAIAERDLKSRKNSDDDLAQNLRPARLAFGYTAMLGIGATLLIIFVVVQ